MKDKKRKIIISIIAIIIVSPILIVLCNINKKDKMYNARKDIDEIASQQVTNDRNYKGMDEINLLLDNICEDIDLTITKVEKENISITPKTTDTLLTVIKDNLHFIELMCSKGKHSILDKKWQDSLEIILSKEKSEKEYIRILNEMKNEIIEFQESL